MSIPNTPITPDTPQAPGTPGAIVLFDGVCNLCNASVNFVIDRDSAGYFKFASLQSEAAAPYLGNCDASLKRKTTLESIVLVEGDACYDRSTAALRIAREMDGLWPLLYGFLIIPRPVRDVVYNWIARNRYRWFGRQDVCRIPTPELRARFVE